MIKGASNKYLFQYCGAEKSQVLAINVEHRPCLMYVCPLRLICSVSFRMLVYISFTVSRDGMLCFLSETLKYILVQDIMGQDVSVHDQIYQLHGFCIKFMALQDKMPQSYWPKNFGWWDLEDGPSPLLPSCFRTSCLPEVS